MRTHWKGLGKAWARLKQGKSVGLYHLKDMSQLWGGYRFGVSSLGRAPIVFGWGDKNLIPTKRSI